MIEQFDYASVDVMRDLEKNGLLYKFEKWCERIEKCVARVGGYVERE